MIGVACAGGKYNLLYFNIHVPEFYVPIDNREFNYKKKYVAWYFSLLIKCKSKNYTFIQQTS